MSYLDLSGFLFLTSSQLLKYKQAWNTFNTIQTINSNVSTLRSSGSSLTYYQFSNNTEMTNFKQGQFLHTQSYPSMNWNTVEEN